MVKDAASVGFYDSVAGKKFARVQLLTIDRLLNNTQRAEHTNYDPDLNFKKARAETDAEQQSLISSNATAAETDVKLTPVALYVHMNVMQHYCPGERGFELGAP